MPVVFTIPTLKGSIRLKAFSDFAKNDEKK